MSKNRSLKKLLILGVLMAGFAMASAWMTDGDIIDWRNDLESAREESRATKKPLILYFTASWCGPCQQMKKSTFADANVRKALSDFVPLKVDVDQHPDLAKAHGVKSVPRILLLNEAGEPTKILTGFVNSQELLEWLRGSP